jgi:hypothetical protein
VYVSRTYTRDTAPAHFNPKLNSMNEFQLP